MSTENAFNEDEYEDYDAGADFGAWFDVDDAGAPSDKPAPPPASTGRATSSVVGWTLGDTTQTARILQLLPSLPEHQRRTPTEKRRERSAGGRSVSDAERAGDRLAREVRVSELLPLLGWDLDGEMADGGSRWVRPDHSEPYDGSHDATVFADEDGVERITVFSERQRAAWGLTEEHSLSSFDLLGRVFCQGDFHLAAGVARLVLADDVPVERLGDLLRKDDSESPQDTATSLLAAVSAAPTVSGGKVSRVHTAVVDWEGECIAESTAPDAHVYVDAGLRIVRRVVVEDDLNPSVPVERLYDIEVKLDGASYVVRDVYSTDLGQPREWLDRIPGAISDEIVISPARQVELEISAALRSRMKLDRPPVDRGLRRIGWAPVGDRIGYVTAQGTVTTTGLDQSLRAIVTGPPAAVSFTEPDTDRLRDDIQTVLSISNLLSESGKNVLTALFAAMAWAHSGVTPPAAGLAILGERGSGKTALVRRILSALSPDPDSLLTSLDSSAGVVGEVGTGAHNSVAWVEDARDKPSDRMTEEQAAAVDSLLRRTYGGGVVGRARLRPDGHGRYVRQDPDRSSPMALITAERLPPSTTISSLERCLTVELLPKAPNEAPFDDRLKHLLDGGCLGRTWGAFMLNLAARIDTMVPGNPKVALASWQEHLGDMRSDVVRGLLEPGNLTTRQAEVVAGFIVGWTLWSDFCAQALDHTDRIAMMMDGRSRLTEAARRHAAGVMDPGEVGPLSVVNRLRQAALGERGWIDGPGFPVPADTSRVDLLGRVVTERMSGKDHVALLHDVAARAIGMRSGTELVGSLGDLVAREQSGRRTRVTVIRGTAVRAVWIPLSIWHGDDASVGTTDVVSTSSDASDEDF